MIWIKQKIVKKEDQCLINFHKCAPFVLSVLPQNVGSANKLNEFFTSVESATAQKAADLALHHDLIAV